MPTLTQVKSLNNTNPNAIEVNTSFALGSSPVDVYRTDKSYAAGERALYLNPSTGKYEVYKCVSPTIAGEFTPVNWVLDNIDQELNESHQIQDEARADLTRAMVHSGILQLDNNTQSIQPNGFLASGVASMSNLLNTLGIAEFKAAINGYQLTVGNNTLYAPNVSRQWSNSSNAVLAEAPTYGTRDDLVFLEAWFEEIKNSSISATNKRKDLKWRIRTATGVDFSQFPEGLGRGVSSLYNSAVPVQGGNNTPLTVVNWGEAGTKTFLSKSERNVTSVAGSKVFLDDQGLYVAGDGTQLSKDTLKTLDGYVYAIPLFRVTRRNSGGYSDTNLNGSIAYVTSKVVTSPIFTGYTMFTYSVTDETFWLNALGKKVTDVNTASKVFTSATVLSVDTVNKKVTLDQSASGDALGGSLFYLDSDRPDGKFADVIEKDDITDLRHTISLTGFDYNNLLDKNFDKFNRGELQTKTKPQLAKERMNLIPAPLGIQAQLVPTPIKLVDGTTVDLLNILGTKGNCESIWLNDSNTTQVLDSSNKAYGSYGTRVTTTSSIGEVSFDTTKLLDNSKYYLCMVDVRNGNMGSVFIKAGYSATTVVTGTSTANITKFTPVYLKLSPADLASVTLLAVKGVGSTGNYFFIDGIRIYEVDQATYDKIDVDPEYSADKLIQKFPYVDSYPNVIENLNNAPYVLGGISNVNGTDESASDRVRSDFIAVKGNATYNLFNANNLAIKYVIEYKTDKTFIKATQKDLSSFSITTDSNTGYIRLVTVTTNPANVKDVVYVNGLNMYVPYGRWMLPADYASGATPLRTDLINFRRVLSDKQTSESVTEIVEALKTPQKNITVTQATEGVWANGDKIKLTSEYGVISGVIDSDTALAKVVRDNTNSNVIYVDDVSKLVVGDTYVLVGSDMSLKDTVNPISAIDTTTKSVTFTGDPISSASGDYLVEVTASSSSPVTTATGLVGTWTGLGTNVAEFTITTAPTTNTNSISIQYSVNYPAGKGISNLPLDVLEAKVNRQKLVKATNGIISTKAIFNGKVSGSTDLIPHTVKEGNTQTSLQAPSSLAEVSNTSYGTLSNMDGTLFTRDTAATTGLIAQQSFSFDIIRLLTDKFGDGIFAGCITLDDKVARVRTMIARVDFNWYGFGSSSAGNKANVSVLNPVTTTWASTVFNTSSTPTLKTITFMDVLGILDTNGFIHYLAYAEPSDGVTPSVINTDYAELEVQLYGSESGYDVLKPDVKYPLLVDAPEIYKAGDNMIPPFSDTRWVLSDLGVTVVNNNEILQNSSVINKDSYILLNVLPNTNYAVNFDLVGPGSVAIYDDSTTGNIIPYTNVPFTFNSGNNKKVRVYFSNTSNTSVDIRFKNLMMTPGTRIRKFVPFDRDIKRKRKLDFQGKVVGSTFTNPHRAINFVNTAIITSPSVSGSGRAENTQNGYSQLEKMDGTLNYGTATGAGTFVQRMYEFDLSHLGLSYSALKAAVRKLTINWTGYGVGDNAGVQTTGATLKTWSKVSSGAAFTWNTAQGMDNNTASPSTITTSVISGADLYITPDQKVYVLVHSTYAASDTIASEVYTDYVNIVVELADYVDYSPANIVKVRKETKEIKLQYPVKSNLRGITDGIELTYKHIKAPVLTESKDVVILAESDGFLISDLSTSVGDKQGTHHWLNPLYKVGNNSAAVFGEFGFGRVPFAADTRKANINSLVTINNNGFYANFTKQYGIPVIKKPKVAIAYYLVSVDGELNLLVVSDFSTSIDIALDGSSDNVALLVPIEGKPLVKGIVGTLRPGVITPNAWKTPEGEIQGYLNDKGEIIATYQ